MRFVSGTLLDPEFDLFDVPGGEGIASGVDGRHAEGFRSMGDASEDSALGSVAGDETEMPVFERRLGVFFVVEAQSGFAIVRVWPVALEALFGEDGADVAVERKLSRREQRRYQ